MIGREASTAIDTTFARARAKLLAARNERGHWEGQLSASALSTATALVALTLYERATATAASTEAAAGRDVVRRLVARGRQWLRRHQNADGGWGDTTLSLSNISTTALCWAALGMHPADADDAAALEISRRAADWLRRAAGSLAPEQLAAAIVRRYGRDRTFSVPILTQCVLSGQFGERDTAWWLVPQLPFEIAALPQRTFRWLRLPVVSYALPALIAIGQVRHARRPTWNPLARLVRRLATGRTLRVLQRIQPTSGGFLEATPLTSFVAMSLIGAGRAEDPVVQRCLDFLLRSVDADGAWPIDTNLATWVTTLSVNTLSPSADGDGLPADEAARIADWLLAQQYRERHPYTDAAPGGWAWTDLPGGVPDADDTAGALLALRQLCDPNEPRVLAAVAAGARWLLDLQNRDGGVPTFCRGWGKLPFDRSGADLTAHALQAWAAWRAELPGALQRRIATATARGLKYLGRVQRTDGAWSPLWFGNEHSANQENLVFGTSRVLGALVALDSLNDRFVADMRTKGRNWLLAAQRANGGWGGAMAEDCSIEETALATAALAADLRLLRGRDATASTADSQLQQLAPAVERGRSALAALTEAGQRFPPAPIGLYFAKLWYYETLYPLIWTVAATSEPPP